MAIIHIVLFEWKSTAKQEQIEEVNVAPPSYYTFSNISINIQACKSMLALEQKCIHPTSQQPYIKSFSGGRNNSPEGQAVGLSHPNYSCFPFEI